MTKKMAIKNKIVAVILTCIFAILFFAGCTNSEDTDKYPDALFVSQVDLIGYREYTSCNESILTITMADSIYAKSVPSDEDKKGKHISIVGAELFPIEKEDGVIEAGGVYEEQLEKIIPKNSDIVEIELTGKQILLLAEQNVKSILAVKNGGKFDDRYYHFGGIGFVYDTKKPYGERIVDSMIGDGDKLVISETYIVSLSSKIESSPKFRNIVGVSEDFVFPGYTIVGNEFSSFVSYVKENGLSTLSPKMVDKAEIDAPKITLIVMASIFGIAIIVVLIVYFRLKKKRKTQSKKNNGQPPIDV